MIYDYIIIGSGFGGSVASLRLAEKGYSVLTLEQGKRYNPEDFPRSNWNLPKYLWLPFLRFFGFQKLSFYTTASIMSGTGVGGGSLVYANTLYIPPDEFFKNLSWQRFGDWKKILAPYFDKASFMLGREKYSRLNIEDRILKEVSEDMNVQDTFDTVHVGVNLSPAGEEGDPYFNGWGQSGRDVQNAEGVWWDAGRMRRIPLTGIISGLQKNLGLRFFRKQKRPESSLTRISTTLRPSG